MSNTETLAVMDWINTNPELEKNMLSIYRQLPKRAQSNAELEIEWNKWVKNQEIRYRLAISQSVGSQWRIDWQQIADMLDKENHA
jgi:hypothetical protein